MLTGMISSVSGKVNTSSSNLGIDTDAQFADAGSVNNIAIGTDSLNSTTDDAIGNVAIGVNALTAITTGVSNTAVGYNVGVGLTAYSQNTIFGNQALSNASAEITGATAIGYLAMAGDLTTGANYTTAVGHQALTALTSGDGNIAIGYRALATITDADGSIGIGYDAAYSTTSGTRNTSIGYRAFRSNQTGHSTVALGYEALFTANHVANDGAVAIGYKAGRLMNCSGGSTANGNTLIGYFSGFDPNIGDGTEGGLTSGTKCTAVGMETLGANANGNLTCARTTVVGYRAGYSLTGADSDDNTFIGKEAGHTVTTGSDNTLIGSDTTTSAVDAVNQIVIGYDATGLGNNYAVIGNGDITRVYAADDTGATLYAGSATVSTSDSRIKEDVKDTMLGLSFINKLRSVEYKKRQPSDYDESLKKKLDWYKNNKTPRTLDELDKNKIRTGFIAQEVGKILKDMGFDENNDIVEIDERNTQQHIAYSKIIPPLVKAVQELSQQIEDLKKG